MRKLFLGFVMLCFSLVLASCDLIGEENTAPFFDGEDYIAYNINSEAPDWTTIIEVYDDEDGVIRIEESMIESNVDFTKEGIYTVDFYVPDSNGVTSHFELTVEIIDNREYTFTLLGESDITLEVGTEFIDDGVNALDLDGSETTYQTNGIVDTSTVGDYTITYTMDGVEEALTRTVHVVDTTAPVITVDTLKLVTDYELKKDWMDYVEITDNYSDIIMAEITENTVNLSTKGEYNITIKATDEAGNEATASFTVIVDDVVLLVNGDSIIDHEVNTDYTDLGATATDSSQNSLNITTSGDVDTTTLGTYTITYVVDEFEDLSITRTVHVVDTTAPSITVEDQSIYKLDLDVDWSTYYTDGFDNFDDTFTVIEQSDNVVYGVPGTYNVDLLAKDSNDNEQVYTFNVTVTEDIVTVLNNINEEIITIDFWNTFGMMHTLYMDQLIEDFEALYPNITINTENHYGSYYEDVANGFNQGAGADIVLGYNDDLHRLIEAGAMVPLNDFIEDMKYGIGTYDFFDSFLEENIYNEAGYMYSLPFAKLTEIVMYNKDKFEAAGITILENETITYETLNDWADVLIDPNYQVGSKDADTCQYLINFDSEMTLFANHTKMNHLDYKTSDNMPLTIDTIEPVLSTLQNVFQQRRVSLPTVWDQYYGSENFINQDVCMEVTYPTGVMYNIPPNNEFEVGFLPLPQLDLDHKVATQTGPNIGIMSNTTDEERLAAWLFISFLLEPENVAFWAVQTGYMPVTHSAVDEPIYQDFMNTSDTSSSNYYRTKAMETAFRQLDYMQTLDIFSGPISNDDYQDLVEEMMINIFYGEDVRGSYEKLTTVFTNLSYNRYDNIDDGPNLLLPTSGIIDSDITLPISIDGYTITWETSNNEYLTNIGEVTMPLFGQGNQVVTLTATITKEEERYTRKYDVIIKEADYVSPYKTIEEIDEAINGSIVEFEGTVSAIYEYGYFLTDGTYAIAVHNPQSTLNVSEGDVIHVKGEKDTYFSQNQIKNVTIEEIVTDNALSIPSQSTPSTISELIQMDTYNRLNFGLMFEITGTIIEEEGKLYLTDGIDCVLIDYMTTDSASVITNHIGDLVTIHVTHFNVNLTGEHIVLFYGIDSQVTVLSSS